jgi:endo-1,4-beta-xylanase
MSLTAFVLFAVLASPALAQSPSVSLLIDLPQYQSSGSTPNLRTVLSQVSTRKGASFHFGSTYDTYYKSNQASWFQNVFNTYFNHVVAENGCKWQGTEPSPGTSSLGSCQAVKSYASARGASFRGHNTFWHSQLPVSLFTSGSTCTR